MPASPPLICSGVLSTLLYVAFYEHRLGHTEGFGLQGPDRFGKGETRGMTHRQSHAQLAGITARYGGTSMATDATTVASTTTSIED